jgi:hypothetical protein
MTAMTKNRPGNPGLKGRLLDNSVEAYILSLETINRLSIKYRVETFAYLVCNAWELLLKAKIIDDMKDRRTIYYPRKRGEPLRSLALRDCLKRVFPNENEPTRCNLERIVELRDQAVHLVISQVPKTILSLFQSYVLNYHKRLVEWFGISLSGRVSVGMMTIVYDFSPESFDMTSPVLRRQLGRDVVEYLTDYQNAVKREFSRLDKPAEYSIDINYKLALVQKTGDADIILSKGEVGQKISIVEVAKDPSKTHPYRQKEVTEQVNAGLGGITAIKPYDVWCVIVAYEIRKRAEFYYKGGVEGSPSQYSLAFVKWLLKEYKKNNGFFKDARKKLKRRQ